MMASMRAVSQGTPVVTIVHDCQVLPVARQSHCRAPLRARGREGERERRAGRERGRQRQAGVCLHPCCLRVLLVRWGRVCSGMRQPGLLPPEGLGRHRAPAEQCRKQDGGPVLHQLLHPPLSDQVVDIPDALLEGHDLTVDYILTPTRVITTGCTRPRPAGVVWSKVGRLVASRAAAASRSPLWATE